MHLLVIEDDPHLRNLLRRLLQDDRHLVEVASTGEEGLEILDHTPGIEGLILDLGLPGISGLEVARRLRARGAALPILVLTARDAIEDRVRGLDAGADDYLVKPFSYEELAARLRALSRRGERTRPEAIIHNGPISLDEGRRQAAVDGVPVRLSAREFSLLECLLRHPGQLLSRDQLLDAAWPYGVSVTPNTVDAYVHLLRTKLGPAAGGLIQTERGTGYRMAEA
jgi:DNA-binding response OmpR family regulator